MAGGGPAARPPEGAMLAIGAGPQGATGRNNVGLIADPEAGGAPPAFGRDPNAAIPGCATAGGNRPVDISIDNQRNPHSLREFPESDTPIQNGGGCGKVEKDKDRVLGRAIPPNLTLICIRTVGATGKIIMFLFVTFRQPFPIFANWLTALL